MAVSKNTVGLYNDGLYLAEDKPCKIKYNEEPVTMVTFVTNNGLTINCTDTQEIYTQDGIKQAKDIKIWDKLETITKDNKWETSIVDDDFASFLGIYYLTKSNQTPLTKLTKFMARIKELIKNLETRIPELKLSECQGLSDKMLAILLTSKQGSFGIPYDINKFVNSTANTLIKSIIDVYGNEIHVEKEGVRNFLYFYINIITDYNCIIKDNNIVIVDKTMPLAIKTIKYNEERNTVYIPRTEEGYIYCNGVKMVCKKIIPKKV